MKVLFATSNPAKVRKYADKLIEHGIELLTLKDFDIDLHPNENGKNALENAFIKAKAYYDKLNIITIGMDNNLYIDGIPEDRQPGTFVKRVNGRELNDDEMIEHYTSLVKEFGGKLYAKWVYGMVVYNGVEKREYTWSKGSFYFVDTPCERRNPGYPLDSISIMPECNKFFVDLTDEDRKLNEQNYNEDAVIEFILNSVKELEK